MKTKLLNEDQIDRLMTAYMSSGMTHERATEMVIWFDANECECYPDQKEITEASIITEIADATGAWGEDM